MSPNLKSLSVLLGSISVSFEKWLPYSSGCLASYAKQKLPPNEFIFHEPLYKTLDAHEVKIRLEGIDILALTTYIWNEAINLEYSNLFKMLNPNGFVIWGGLRYQRMSLPSKTIFPLDLA